MKTFATAIVFVLISLWAYGQTVIVGPLPNFQFFMGTVPPTSGNNGDVFVHTGNGNVYQMVSGAWTGPTMNVIGPQGPAGATGPAGANGTNGTNTASASASVTTDTAGLYVWTYPAPCTSSSKFWAQAQGPNPTNGVLVNVQNEGAATSTTQSFRANKTNVTVVALLGLSILSVPASVGATPLNVFCTP